MRKWNGFTPEEIQFISENYFTMSASKIGKILARNRASIKNYCQRNGLKKGGTGKGLFQKGHTPHNKGKKGYCAPGSEKGQFKKGNLPHNTKADGVITIRQKQHPDGRLDKPYKWIRLAKGHWEMLHRHVWKQAGRRIRKDCVITFINGDSLDCRLENLEMITKRTNVRLNQNTEKAMLHDNMMALHMTRKEPHLRELVKQNPELIALKRAQILLNREIKKHECSN